MVDKRGRVFYARVLGARATGGLTVEPLDRRISWRQATPREVIDHWARTRTDHTERPSQGQLSLDGVADQ
jgi:hypothetical protein